MPFVGRLGLPRPSLCSAHAPTTNDLLVQKGNEIRKLNQSTRALTLGAIVDRLNGRLAYCEWLLEELGQMRTQIHAILIFTATAIAFTGLGLGLLAMRPEPAHLLVKDGKQLDGVLVGCGNDKLNDKLKQPTVPNIVVVALNPDGPEGGALCDIAVQHLPIYWRITPRAACRRLADHARMNSTVSLPP